MFTVNWVHHVHGQFGTQLVSKVVATGATITAIRHRWLTLRRRKVTPKTNNSLFWCPLTS